MSSVVRRMSESFMRLKEALGFSEAPVSRTIPLHPKALKEAREHVMNNVVRTSKYTFFTFLPVNLFQQLSKAANVYFLIITVM